MEHLLQPVIKSSLIQMQKDYNFFYRRSLLALQFTTHTMWERLIEEASELSSLSNSQGREQAMLMLMLKEIIELRLSLAGMVWGFFP